MDMLIEIKVKVTENIEGKPKKRTETFLMDSEFFAHAEYAIHEEISSDSSITEFEIQSLKRSTIKEVASQYQGEHSYIATLKSVFITDDGTEKLLKYKVLLWSDSLSGAFNNASEIVRQGYNMGIESIKEVDYYYMENHNNEQQRVTETE